jgi:hypothetical protein
MKTLLWTAAITAVVYAVFGPLLLAELSLWSGASLTWILVDAHPWLGHGPWSVVAWPAMDMFIELGLYVATVAIVCLAAETWRSFTKRLGARPARRLTLRHQL